MKPIFGVVADDFTGASDAASFLQQQGLQTVLSNGIPSQPLGEDEGWDAVVIALKSRTAPIDEAVRQSLSAFDWLSAHGADQLYFKYCSTFDSTPEGNIGPVIDAVLERINQPYTFLSPALPVNGRVVEEGHLYVNGLPLHHSSMKNHPLTPMWDSFIPNLMAGQSKYPCLVFPISNDLQQDQQKLNELVETQAAISPHFTLVPDYRSEQDAETVASLFGSLPFLTGGSGILAALGRRRSPASQTETKPGNDMAPASGRSIILAGSTSAATNRQVEAWLQQGGTGFRIDPQRLMEAEGYAAQVFEAVSRSSGDLLVYSSQPPEEMRANQERYGIEPLSAKIEALFHDLARQVKALGFSTIIVAGGETSGTVTHALGYNLFRIGEPMAPGVPVMIPLADPDTKLVLKSGNFGGDAFFAETISKLREARP